jgi:hypothetical protein
MLAMMVNVLPGVCFESFFACTGAKIICLAHVLQYVNSSQVANLHAAYRVLKGLIVIRVIMFGSFHL